MDSAAGVGAPVNAQVGPRQLGCDRERREPAIPSNEGVAYLVRNEGVTG